MINIVSKAKVGAVDVDMQIDFLQAMESARIDRSETCFQGFGFLHVDDLVEYMECIDEMCDESPW